LINLFSGLNLVTESLETSSAIIAARVIGKVLGISLMVFLSTRLFSIKLADELTMHDVVGVGLLGGMGMAVSLVIADIATKSEAMLNQVKVGLFISAFLSALLAMAWFKLFPRSVLLPNTNGEGS
jgi:NhaA family Na+:H+ antiporter